MTIHAEKSLKFKVNSAFRCHDVFATKIKTAIQVKTFFSLRLKF